MTSTTQPMHDPTWQENSMSLWDDPELRAGGEFIKLENVGDSVSGTIQAVRRHKFDDGNVVPQLLLRTDPDGEERTLTVGQVRLKAELAERRPEAGDWIRVELTDIEKRAGGRTLKHFSVDVRHGSEQSNGAAQQQPQQQSQPQQPQQQGQLDPAVLAALGNLSPEQRQQLLGS